MAFRLNLYMRLVSFCPLSRIVVTMFALYLTGSRLPTIASLTFEAWMRTHISDDIKYKSMVLAFWDMTPVTASRL